LVKSAAEFVTTFLVTTFSEAFTNFPVAALLLAGAGLIFFKGLALIVVLDDFGID
jgi:hypothetical protein